jgi:hypothetical protein
MHFNCLLADSFIEVVEIKFQQLSLVKLVAKYVLFKLDETKHKIS